MEFAATSLFTFVRCRNQVVVAHSIALSVYKVTIKVKLSLQWHSHTEPQKVKGHDKWWLCLFIDSVTLHAMTNPILVKFIVYSCKKKTFKNVK